MLRTWVLGTAVALVVVLVVAGGLWSSPTGRPARSVAPAGDVDAADGAARADFLDLFEQSRLGSWKGVFEYERAVGGDVGLSGTIVEVNVPPERIVTGIGGFTYRRDGELVSCAVLEESVRECRPPQPARPLREQAEREVEELRGRTDPGAGDLEVREVEGVDVAGTPTRCFEVRFVDDELPDRTETCFDETGIPLRFVLDRDEGRLVDTRTATSFGPADIRDVEEVIADYPVDPPASDSEPLPRLT